VVGIERYRGADDQRSGELLLRQYYIAVLEEMCGERAPCGSSERRHPPPPTGARAPRARYQYTRSREIHPSLCESHSSLL
jgi:hypothetical protein